MALTLGTAAAVLVGFWGGEWRYSPAVGWIVAAGVYLAWTWRTLLPMDGEQTGAHVAERNEDGTLGLSEVVVAVASIASLAGVGYLLAAEGGSQRRLGEALVGILSVVASWLAIHTTFTLRYARIYYQDVQSDPVDFGRAGYRPSYLDFAYLAFTVGMTYQVSDTSLRTRQMRGTVLAQALVSFMLGAVVLASTVNLVLEVAGRQ